MTAPNNDCINDTTWKGNVSARVRRVEIIIFVITISFVSILSHAILIHSSQRELQVALSSLLDVQQSISSLSGTQVVLQKQIEIINAKISEKKLKLTKPTKHIIQSSPTKHRKGYSSSKDFPLTSTSSVKPKPKQNADDDDDDVIVASLYHPKTGSRKMKLQNNSTKTTTSCTGTFFRLELQLDENPKQTSFVLMNMDTRDTVANVSFNESDSIQNTIFETCLEDGRYQFKLQDSVGDGIECFDSFDGLPCYNIYLNHGLAIPGRPFQHSLRTHEFDTRSLCFEGNEVVIEINFDNERTRAEGLTIIKNMTNIRTRKPVNMSLAPNQDRNSTAKKSIFNCLTPSTYILKLRSESGRPIICDGPCFTISVNNKIIIQGKESFSSTEHEFFITIDGIGRELTCTSNPLLSPISSKSHSTFDERVSKIIDVVQALSDPHAIFTRGSSQYKATCYILYDDPLEAQAENTMLLQRYALAVLLYSTNEMTEVHIALDVCFNDKIKCNAQGEVISVEWNGGGLNGYISTEIGYLKQLETLRLGSKKMRGTIPTEIQRLTKLTTLILGKNDFTGTIPTVIGTLPLQIFDIHDNRLSGSIPTELGITQTFEKILLSNNMLTGTIPPEIFNARSLRVFEIDDNQLSGSIPSEVGNAKNLSAFTARNNTLSGTIPPSFGNLASFKILFLPQNSLIGSISKEMENNQLDIIVLSDNLLTGPLPNLNVRRGIYLFNNFLTGTIPESIFNPSISRFDLSNNKLLGEVPQDFCDNMPFVQQFPGVHDLFVDHSTWFLNEPFVSCPCCDDLKCHIWKNKEISMTGSARKTSCPKSNIFKKEVFELFVIEDTVANVSDFEFFGVGIVGETDLCLSPTGCFDLKHDVVGGRNDLTLTWDREYKLGYSSVSKTLTMQNTCDAVDICGILIGPDHPKRMGLNHLTHVAVPDLSILDDSSLPEYKALCWIMTQDTMFHDYDICDGTLLQRYIMALFFFSFQKSFGFDTLRPTHTCEWQGVTCDPLNKYIEHLVFSNRKLHGSFITEIRLLTRLKTLVLNNNFLVGTIDSSTFEHMPNLELFDVGANEIGGTIPKTMFQLPQIEQIVLSNNVMVGELPADIEYSKSIKKIDVENNLLVSSIPKALIGCPKLEVINLSRNNFHGNIPSDIGFLENMREIKLHQNAFTGNIPTEIFNLKLIEQFELQSNSFIGTISTEIGNLKNAILISLSHNFLKGMIPTEMEHLNKIEQLHLQDNFLTGIAPFMPKLQELGRSLGEVERYITDCGDPSYLLASPLKCKSCTLCCNSDKLCQENRIGQMSLDKGAFIAVFGIPIALGFIFFVISYGSKGLYQRIQTWGNVSILREVDLDSTYCLCFSSTYMAWVIYLVVFTLQGCFYYMFLLASSFSSDSSDWQYTYQCQASSGLCENGSSVDTFGWFMFFVVTLFTLSVDCINSTKLILLSVAKLDLRMFINGFFHLGMTIFALFSSYYYNLALATTNTELIVNAVILLFVNDLDEQLMNAMQALAPGWVEMMYEDIKAYLATEGHRTKRIQTVFSSSESDVPELDLSLETTRPSIETILVRSKK